jgi:hypothetical protein
MVTAMDRSIGTVLRRLKSLGIERDTLVVFTSDNGPEDIAGKGDSGTPGSLRGWKRYLYEGGLRVPTIWQWIGTIPRGRNITTLGVSTDLFPTFLDAAGISVPENVRLDGTSLLPVLTASPMRKKKYERAKRALDERVVMWHGKKYLVPSYWIPQNYYLCVLIVIPVSLLRSSYHRTLTTFPKAKYFIIYYTLLLMRYTVDLITSILKYILSVLLLFSLFFSYAKKQSVP